MADKER